MDRNIRIFLGHPLFAFKTRQACEQMGKNWEHGVKRCAQVFLTHNLYPLLNRTKFNLIAQVAGLFYPEKQAREKTQ